MAETTPFRQFSVQKMASYDLKIKRRRKRRSKALLYLASKFFYQEIVYQ